MTGITKGIQGITKGMRASTKGNERSTKGIKGLQTEVNDDNGNEKERRRYQREYKRN